MARTVKKAYTKSKAFDSSCRCHGGCGWCYDNRMHKNHKRYGAKTRISNPYKRENND